MYWLSNICWNNAARQLRPRISCLVVVGCINSQSVAKYLKTQQHCQLAHCSLPSSCNPYGGCNTSMELMASPDGASIQCEADPSRLVQDAPKSLTIKYACHLEQLEGESWFSTHDKTPPIAQPHRHDTTAHDSLADRYTEALWLGEFHTGLSHFLNCIDRLRSSHELEEILLGLCQLIRSNSSISRRHQAAARALLPHPGPTTEHLAKKMQDLIEYEKILVQQAIDKAGSGQISGQVIVSNVDSLRERWVSSMESREYVWQIDRAPVKILSSPSLTDAAYLLYRTGFNCRSW